MAISTSLEPVSKKPAAAILPAPPLSPRDFPGWLLVMEKRIHQCATRTPWSVRHNASARQRNLQAQPAGAAVQAASRTSIAMRFPIAANAASS